MPDPKPVPDGPPYAFRVGPWLVEPALNRLTREGDDVRVERKVMQLLVCLANEAGRPVLRQRLFDELWGYHVSDDALHSVVAKLRRALDPDGSIAPIETVPKVGYRLVLPVVAVADAPVGGVEAGRATHPGGPDAGTRPPGRRYALGLLVAAAALLTIAWWRPAAAPAVDDRPSRVVPITSEPGLEVEPALSPGPGDRVAYAARGAGENNWDLHLRTVGGGPALRLTNTPADEHHPAWSADASRIAFGRWTPDTCELWTVGPLGGDERRVAPCPGRDVTGISWAAPDQLLVSTRPDSRSSFAIYMVPLDGSAASRLTHPPAASVGDVHARLSPDGRMLAVAFSPAVGVQDLYVSPVAGGPRRRLTDDHVKIHGFDWTPDGCALVFSSNRSGLFGLWRIAADGTRAPEHLAVTADDLDAPSVSAGGARIAYERWLTETSVHRASLDAPSSSTSLLAFTRWLWQLDVSPVNGALAVVSDRSGSPELWTSGAEGDGPVQRTRVGGPYVSSPRWSPDGTRIAFVDAGHLRVLDDATSTVLDPMTDDETGESRHPSWSANGQELYYASNRTGTWQIMRLDLPSGTDVQVTADGGTTARASADGQSLFFTKPHRAGLWRKHLASGEETLVLETLAPVDDLSWTLTPRAVFYVRRVDDRPMLHRFDLGDASDRQVGALPGLMTRSGLAVSSDERQVWFVRIDRQEADILMLERPRAAR